MKRSHDESDMNNDDDKIALTMTIAMMRMNLMQALVFLDETRHHAMAWRLKMQKRKASKEMHAEATMKEMSD